MGQGRGSGLAAARSAEAEGLVRGGEGVLKRGEEEGREGEEGQLHQVVFMEGTDKGVVKMVKACLHDGADVAAAVRCCEWPAS